MNLWNWIVPLAFLFVMVSNASGQVSKGDGTAWVDDIVFPVNDNSGLPETYIYYEVLNEPHDISNTKRGDIQQTVIHAIHAVDQIHTIIVGPANWNNYMNLRSMPE